MNTIFSSKSNILLCLLMLCLMMVVMAGSAIGEPIIVDHTCTDLSAIPAAAIEAAKSQLHIAYGHTSHGSQLITGMNALENSSSLYSFNSGGSGGALDLHDTPFSGASDLGAPDRIAWEAATRNYLTDHPDINVIIWSWCGEVDGTETQIQQYLDLMTGLEQDYPNVKFVYMTGHLTGTGATGNVNIRNNQIRAHCNQPGSNHILFDFADIESYDPDGLTNFMELFANDDCNYSGGNWAEQWITANPTHELALLASTSNCGTCAHSQRLNCVLKGRAAWWLWARLAGWNECTSAPENLSVSSADSTLGQIQITWDDTSADEVSFIVQRQVNGTGWDNSYATVPANSTAFTDTGLSAGTYQYRIVAHLDTCDSSASNIASADIVNPNLPDAPGNLTATADSIAGTIALAWSDNSTNEDGFVIQRQVDGGVWNDTYASVAAGATSYTDSGLSSGNYAYRVIATNTYGDSNPSNIATANIVQSVPEAPTGLSSLVNGFDITLTWTDSSDNEDAFVVERSIDGGSFSALVSNLPAGTQTYSDINLTALHTYAYRVKAINSFGDSAYSNETSQYIYDQVVTIKLNNDDTGQIIDAFLRSSAPDTNFGDTLYETNYDRFIVQFNLPAEVMGKQIVSASLSFYVWSVDSTDAGTLLDIYRVTQPWEESTVTWNSISSATAESVGQIAVEYIDHQYLTPVDVTNVVQQWVNAAVPNYGLMLDKGPDVGMGVKASEYALTASPYLEITYTNKTCVADNDNDGDVDGADLVALVNNFNASCLSDFAVMFGR